MIFRERGISSRRRREHPRCKTMRRGRADDNFFGGDISQTYAQDARRFAAAAKQTWPSHRRHGADAHARRKAMRRGREADDIERERGISSRRPREHPRRKTMRRGREETVALSRGISRRRMRAPETRDDAPWPRRDDDSLSRISSRRPRKAHNDASTEQTMPTSCRPRAPKHKTMLISRERGISRRRPRKHAGAHASTQMQDAGLCAAEETIAHGDDADETRIT